jgi:hypothetical protein
MKKMRNPNPRIIVIIIKVDRGNAKRRLQDYRGAIADYSRVIKLNPNNAVLHYNRGFAKYRLGK